MNEHMNEHYIQTFSLTKERHFDFEFRHEQCLSFSGTKQL